MSPEFHILDSGPHLRIRDVSAIPSQQVFDSMNGSDRDMERVNFGSIRNGAVGDKRSRQVYGLGRGSKDRQSTESRKTPPRRQRIAGARFLQNYRRNV